MGKWKHPDTQTKKRTHRYFSLSFFSRLSKRSKLLADSCQSIFLSWPTTHFFTGLRVGETTTLNEKTQNYMGGVSTKFSPCFSFSASQISRYDVSPDLRSTIFISAFPPLLLKQRGADWDERHRYQRLDLQCWECVFRTHGEAQSGTVGPFHSKSWVLWTAWHSQCVCGNVKKLSQNSIVMEFFCLILQNLVTASYVKWLS